MSAGSRTCPARIDGRAWDWRTCRAHAVRLARLYARCPEEAEDIAQEALLRAWRMRETCRNGDAPWAWLAQITRNEALRVLTRPIREVPEEVGAAPGSAEDDRLASAPSRLDLQAALEALSPSDRILVALRYGEDLTQAGIADRLGMPEGTVKVRLHRLRRTLHRGVSPT